MICNFKMHFQKLHYKKATISSVDLIPNETKFNNTVSIPVFSTVDYIALNNIWIDVGSVPRISNALLPV